MIDLLYTPIIRPSDAVRYSAGISHREDIGTIDCIVFGPRVPFHKWVVQRASTPLTTATLQIISHEAVWYTLWIIDLNYVLNANNTVGHTCDMELFPFWWKSVPDSACSSMHFCSRNSSEGLARTGSTRMATVLMCHNVSAHVATALYSHCPPRLSWLLPSWRCGRDPKALCCTRMSHMRRRQLLACGLARRREVHGHLNTGPG